MTISRQDVRGSGPHRCAICVQEPGHGYRAFALLLGRLLRSLWVTLRAASRRMVTGGEGR